MPDINVVCERLTVGGLPTRFEDQARLPVSPCSFGALAAVSAPCNAVCGYPARAGGS